MSGRSTPQFDQGSWTKSCWFVGMVRVYSIDKTELNGILFSYKPLRLRHTEAGFWQQEHQLDSFACQKFVSPSHCERWIIMSPLHHSSSSSSSSLPMFLFANHLWLTLFLLLIPLFVANEGTQHNQSHLPAVGESQDQTNQQWAHSSCLDKFHERFELLGWKDLHSSTLQWPCWKKGGVIQWFKEFISIKYHLVK